MEQQHERGREHEGQRTKVVVIGAGMGGLATAIRLAAAGQRVTLIEAAGVPGGKARTIASIAGPVDAGPTVLTLRRVFDDLFALAGERLEDHVTLIPQLVLARHWWPDGSRLDLTTNAEANIAAISDFAGMRAGQAFARFDRMSAELYAAFEAPVMQAARPTLGHVVAAALRAPGAWPALMPGMSLQRLLTRHFDDPRLVQLFARYATYVGGKPGQSPGVLALIWRAEAAGVWAVEGGMHRLALALAALADRLGVELRYATAAQRIVTQQGRVTGVQIAGGATLPCDACVFNGDPAALVAGFLGEAAQKSVAPLATQPRSLSAWVWAFGARVAGAVAPDLIHHNVFFTANPKAEFGPIARGQMPLEPTLYVCAEDRARGVPQPDGVADPGYERFEIIINASPGQPALPQDYRACHSRTFERLQSFGLTFSPAPEAHSLITPSMLAQQFPGSQGAIYGRIPEGSFAAFRRPGAQTALPGLYLAGGGAHPGAGVPMAALSGRHAAEAILNGPTSRSTWRQMAMPGGTSTASRRTDGAPSR